MKMKGNLYTVATSLLVAGLIAGCGGGGFSATAQAAKSAYVANFNDNTVSQYTIDATTGALTPNGTPIATGAAGPISVAVDQTGKYAYVANSGTTSTNGVSA
jgi:DNA-binding beta-propeller fold protein YncE